ncbi:Abi family protein [Adlercreutzia sp. R25]|uniref:Abi family protein n=1 Tax=Adlercreutzia shanghongiae TaxID=3111773 RepID=UPI002DB7081D|nr:Abi family protein [Adlercreutzia sp. R25]MEC4273421.1 Abi family protein [Adlercreutzia sp. R25]
MDFAYLVDLSRKDAVLRELVLDLALDLEHYLKVVVNRVLMESNLKIDSLIEKFFAFSKKKALAQIVQAPLDEAADANAKKLQSLSAEFLNMRSSDGSKSELAAAQAQIYSAAYSLCGGIDCDHVERSLLHFGSSRYSKRLVEKYGSLEIMQPWHFMEMASFGDFIAFYKFLFFDSGEHDQLKHCSEVAKDVRNAQHIKRLLFPAKTLRNAAAHNDYLLNDLKHRMKEPIKSIYKHLIELYDIPKTTIDKSWKTPAAHDYASLLICYGLIVPDGETKTRAARKMHEGFCALSQNLSYYREQDDVFCSLELIAKLTDCFSKRWQIS